MLTGAEKESGPFVKCRWRSAVRHLCLLRCALVISTPSATLPGDCDCCVQSLSLRLRSCWTGVALLLIWSGIPDGGIQFRIPLNTDCLLPHESVWRGSVAISSDCASGGTNMDTMWSSEGLAQCVGTCFKFLQRQGPSGVRFYREVLAFFCRRAVRPSLRDACGVLAGAPAGGAAGSNGTATASRWRKLSLRLNVVSVPVSWRAVS